MFVHVHSVCVCVCLCRAAPIGHVGVWWVAQSCINSQRAGRQGGRADIDRKRKYSLLVAHHFLCVLPEQPTLQSCSLLFARTATEIRLQQ